jgi:hypothetical protein
VPTSGTVIGTFLFGPAWLRKERVRALDVAPHASPVFVLGNQKSGTTAIAALLAAATGLRATLDFAGAWHPFISPLVRGDTDMNEFVRINAWAFSAPIVKEPNLTFVSDRLLERFPLARAVFIVRNPWDNIRSILARLKVRGDLDSSCNLTRANRTWRDILAGEDIQLPPDHYVATLARRWLRANDMSRLAGPRATLLRYEDFCADKAGTIYDLARRLGLPVSFRIEKMVDRAFQRRSGSVRDPASFFGARNLARITDIAAARAGEIGYRTPA